MKLTKESIKHNVAWKGYRLPQYVKRHFFCIASFIRYAKAMKKRGRLPPPAQRRLL